MEEDNFVFANRCGAASCRAAASTCRSCFSLAECGCADGAPCEPCAFRLRMQDRICAANRAAASARGPDADGARRAASVYAGPHPIDALMTLYHHDGGAHRDRIAYSWMGCARAAPPLSFSIRETLSNRELYEGALAVSHLLKVRMGADGDGPDGFRERVVLCFEPGLGFIVAFLGVMLAGLIAVPVYPAQPRAMMMRKDSHVARVVRDCGARFALTSDKYYALVAASRLVSGALPGRGGGAWDGGLRWLPISIGRLRRSYADVIAPVGSACAHGGGGCPVQAGPLRVLRPRYRLDDVAFLQVRGHASHSRARRRPGAHQLPREDSSLTHSRTHARTHPQYTSGSTMHPKAVVVTHRALVHNIAQLLCVMAPISSESCEVSWLPQYHDMGLIGAALVRLGVLGGRAVLFDPLLFLRTPLSWPIAMSQFGATHTGGPDFAYGLIARREMERRRGRRGGTGGAGGPAAPAYDLSRLHFALIGGERVRESTMRTLVETFGDSGLRPDALCPSYGLAESCVYVSHERGLVVDRGAGERDRDGDGDGDDAYVMVPPGAPSEGASGPHEPRCALSVGQPVPGFGVEIVIARIDAQGEVVRGEAGAVRLASDGGVGEIWVRSSSCTPGYWDQYRRGRGGGGAVADATSSGYLHEGGARFLRTGGAFTRARRARRVPTAVFREG